MKILLIQPKMNKRPMDTDLKTRMSPPLGLFTLLSLTPEGHETRIINENVEKVPYHYPADLVGITVTLDVFPRACEIAAKFQSRGVPVVAGGIHVTCSPEECLPYFDAICVGPAERVWAKMISDAVSRNLRKVYHDAENFRGEEIAPPKYEAIDRKKYLYTNVVTTSRGCPCRCDFCYNSSGNRCYVRRPVADVVRDIKSLKTRHIYFVDDNFIGDIEYTRELLGKLKGMNLKWNAAVTTKILNHPDLLDFMVETGCQSLFIGFESVNGTALAGVHKDNNPALYERLAHELHKRGIMVNASMVFGLDGDGADVFDNTLNWLVKNKIETLTAHILTPYPGTRLYERMEQAGRISDRNLAHYNTAHVVFKPRGLSPKELYKGYLRIYRRFYSFRNIFRRRPDNPKQRKPYFMFNFLYRKFGGFSSALCRLVPMNIIGRIAERISYKI
ncbi:MAG: B12-binding domain-containing radical SAM protein [Oscillospiraceae bacterium]|nr:B12-binding domain-containing radical SAM protein [Oscillospiraceae bacterium]